MTTPSPMALPTANTGSSRATWVSVGSGVTAGAFSTENTAKSSRLEYLRILSIV